jgi:hypothetical protein
MFYNDSLFMRSTLREKIMNKIMLRNEKYFVRSVTLELPDFVLKGGVCV